MYVHLNIELVFRDLVLPIVWEDETVGIFNWPISDTCLSLRW